MKKWWDNTKEEFGVVKNTVNNVFDYQIKKHSLQNDEKGIHFTDFMGYSWISAASIFIPTIIGGPYWGLGVFSVVFAMMGLLLYLIDGFEHQKQKRNQYNKV